MRWLRLRFICDLSTYDHSTTFVTTIGTTTIRLRFEGGHGSVVRTIELDLRPHNIGLNTAWMRAQDRSKWRQLVDWRRLCSLMGALLDDDDDDDDDDDRHCGLNKFIFSILCTAYYAPPLG